jgi:hypothetical protein
MGFEYFYGFMGGETDQWTPFLFRDHTQIFPWVDKPGYNLTTDLADDAIGHMKQLNAASPDQPFFVYYVPSPHQPTKEWIEKFKGKFDMGWNTLRDQIFANQKRLGVIPANTELTPWPDDLPKWETLSSEEKKLFARQAQSISRHDRTAHDGRAQHVRHDPEGLADGGYQGAATATEVLALAGIPLEIVNALMRPKALWCSPSVGSWSARSAGSADVAVSPRTSRAMPGPTPHSSFSP